MRDPDQEPVTVRVAEVTLPIHEWDRWREQAEATSRRARRAALVLGGLTAVALAVVGVVLLSDAAVFSVVLYAPAGGAVVWATTRRVVTRRGLAPLVAQAREVVVPALVERIDTEDLITLVTQGGTLVTVQSTSIVADRRESLVALVASEYDVSDFPAASFPVGGFGP